MLRRLEQLFRRDMVPIRSCKWVFKIGKSQNRLFTLSIYICIFKRWLLSVGGTWMHKKFIIFLSWCQLHGTPTSAQHTLRITKLEHLKSAGFSSSDIGFSKVFLLSSSYLKKSKNWKQVKPTVPLIWTPSWIPRWHRPYLSEGVPHTNQSNLPSRSC